jgi:tetratricopeptide (TPR) repeat protein
MIVVLAGGGGPGVRLRLVVSILLMLSGAALAAEPTIDEAMSLLQAGKRKDALRAFNVIIAAKPADPSEALFQAGRLSLDDGNWRAARPLLEKLVKLRPGSFPSWELMIQACQAAGDTDCRNDAIQSLYDAWHTALDPETQSQVAFRRDRIFGPKRTVVALETLDPGGDDIVRFLFQPVDDEHHLILVRADNETNTRWRESGLIPPSTIVYHLDTVEQLPSGKTSDRSYEFYLEPPEYDVVRAKVLQILSGTIKPTNGEPDPFWTTDTAR